MIVGVNAIRAADMLHDLKTLVTLTFVIITHKWQTKRKRKYKWNNTEQKSTEDCLALHMF